jgi:hypothetical protein
MERLRNIQISPVWLIPSLIFAACFVSFGLLLSNLGYFQDDWHHVYYAYHEGSPGLQNFFFTDSRPFAYFIYNIFFSVLGFDPSHWHWALMALRFATALTFWLMLRALWPGREDLTAWLAIFFAIHPVFTLQSLSVAYTLHWVAYLSVALSFLFMVLAIQNQRRFWQFSTLALLLQGFHLLMMEYYAGLEIFRILLIFLALPKKHWLEQIKKAFLTWIPYLFVLSFYAVYRLSYSKTFGYDRFEPVLLTGLLNSPLSTLIQLFQFWIQDFIFIVIAPWYRAVEPSVFALTQRYTWIMIAISSFFVGLFYWGISKISMTVDKEKVTPFSLLQLALYGVLSLSMGMLPAWIIGFSMFEKNPLWSSRFALPAMLGASLIMVGAIFFFIQNPMRRNLFLSLLLGVAIASQMQIARDFKFSWDKQLQFYWQLHWRAPALLPGTLIVADEEILPYMGDSPTAYAVNLLYPKTFPNSQADYWFSPGSKEVPDSFVQSESVEISKYSSTFFASPQRVIAINFSPEEGECLWFLRPEYHEIRFLSQESYYWMQLSDVSLAGEHSTFRPPTSIFGDEPAHTWCYYYQKADLAEQGQDWQEVIQIWEAARERNFRPSNSVEMLPFIKAYANLSQWEQAQRLTLQANTLPPRMRSLLCTLWFSFEEWDTDVSGQDIIYQTREKLDCQK